MKLEIQTVGHSQFPRFVIANDQGEFWDGAGWTSNRDKAILFMEGQTVARQFRVLEGEQAAHLPLREFAVTLNIRVRSAQQFSQEELEQHLEQAVSIFIDKKKDGGKFEDGIVQMDVTWGLMSEKAVSQDEGRPA